MSAIQIKVSFLTFARVESYKKGFFLCAGSETLLSGKKVHF